VGAWILVLFLSGGAFEFNFEKPEHLGECRSRDHFEGRRIAK
jgi:hypothetical protein